LIKTTERDKDRQRYSLDSLDPTFHYSPAQTLAQTGIYQLVAYNKPKRPWPRPGFSPLGMIQLLSRQGGQGRPIVIEAN
jgi:hypothetical protein